MAINRRSGKDDITLAYDCAKLYYEKDLSQNEISDLLKLSRSKTSRLLDLARKTGIVTITLKPPEIFDQTKLAKKLCEKYGIARALIGIPTEDAELPIKQAIGRAFQEHFPSILGKRKRIGIGWGTTIYAAMCELKGELNYRDTTVSPLVGGAGESHPAYQVNNLTDLLANWLHSNRIYLMGPAIFDSPEQMQSFASSSAATAAVALWKNLDIAIFSVGGSLDNSDILHSSFPKDFVVELVSHHVIGDILARFFDKKGKIVGSNIEDVFLGIPFNLFLKVPEKICLAGGRHKTISMDAALRAGYITTLITDIYTAQALVTL
jgi:deoxyribonucleoside regulator